MQIISQLTYPLWSLLYLLYTFIELAVLYIYIYIYMQEHAFPHMHSHKIIDNIYRESW